MQRASTPHSVGPGGAYFTLDHYASPGVGVAPQVQYQHQPLPGGFPVMRNVNHNVGENFVPGRFFIGNNLDLAQLYSGHNNCRRQGVGPLYNDFQDARSVSHLNRPGKNIKPPSFDGQLSFKDFLVQFELVSQLAG